MAAGLQVFNNDGFVQIDANYLNMELKSKGSATIGPSNLANGGSQMGKVAFAVAGENPIVAVISSGYVACYLASQSGNAFTFEIYNGENANTAVEWFVFDNSSGEGAGNTGFQVFNPAGRLVFDAGKKYLRVVDYWEKMEGNLDVPDSRNYPGKRIAVVMCDYRYRFMVTNSPANPGSTTTKFVQSQLDCSRTINDTLTVKLTATFTNANAPNPGVGGAGEGPSRWLVVDVSNY